MAARRQRDRIKTEIPLKTTANSAKKMLNYHFTFIIVFFFRFFPPCDRHAPSLVHRFRLGRALCTQWHDICTQVQYAIQLQLGLSTFQKSGQKSGHKKSPDFKINEIRNNNEYSQSLEKISDSNHIFLVALNYMTSSRGRDTRISY